MVDEGVAAGNDDGGLFPQSVGERLRATRIAAGLDLNDVAGKTRVPMRHLEAIERGDYSALPSATYAIGFTRSFARAVGANEADIARDLRAELGRTATDDAEYIPYEPVDPARVPSRLLAWTAATLAVVLLVGYLVWRSDWLSGDATAVQQTPVAASAPPAIAPPPVAVSTPSPSGQVVLTATAPVWLRIYDKADKVLLQKELAAGETFTVPTDADTPMIRTGRPDALKVTIDGQDVAPLGAPETTIRDVQISAQALTARGTAAETPPPVAVPASAPARIAPKRPRPVVRRDEPSPSPVAAPIATGNSTTE